MSTTAIKPATQPSNQLIEVEIQGEWYYKIPHADSMRPFLISMVSDSNHWLFQASNGGITAGRQNPDYALFPYDTDDKLIDSAEHTGPKTIIRIQDGENTITWEPFSIRSEASCKTERNLYKSRWGNAILFEEIYPAAGLRFRYQWNSSDTYGFVRKASISNLSGKPQKISIIDGLQNILPYGVGQDLQQKVSNLTDAYKRSELQKEAGLGLYALSAIIVDKAEPSEALKANIAWSMGLPNPVYLLSNRQLQAFRKGSPVREEMDVKGEKGAYLIQSDFVLEAAGTKEWLVIANVNQSQPAIIRLMDEIKANRNLQKDILADIQKGTDQLIKRVAAADGLQQSADRLKNSRHFANVLFNIMRGGIFDDQYRIEKWDFTAYLLQANAEVYTNAKPVLEGLPENFSLFELETIIQRSSDPSFIRLSKEYLPLTFSRRHGDPSRPWNQFSINTRNETDGSKILDYQGNWRDIFQNWEALSYAYPAFIEGMIYKFLNASTFDGYNPYRVTKDGFDWETIEADNPWSYIGYWGDHQIIYLLKFLEFLQAYRPQTMSKMLTQSGFVYAHVPYRIKPYREILKNPKDSILFDHLQEKKILERKKSLGADAALLLNATGKIHEVSFTEKILATVLAKLSNFVPGAGIWMNTQRPEWNDANNALVGNGLSMVTLYYLRRFLTFFNPIWESHAGKSIALSAELKHCLGHIASAFQKYKPALEKGLSNCTRKEMLDLLGQAASDYREGIYTNSFSGQTSIINTDELQIFFQDALSFLEQAINANKRTDGLYHTYNLLSIHGQEAGVSHLPEMLEGQVAVLSSGYLSASESLHVLDALKKSSLFRPDQYSYLLYPNKELPGFLQKNTFSVESVQSSPLVSRLLADGNRVIMEKDTHGTMRFNGNFRNAADLEVALENLGGPYRDLVKNEKSFLLGLFEEVFNHKEFTGRSGTFFAYEGLGSIYWHMVSKLLLAVQETCMRAVHEGADKDTMRQLIAHYYEIQEGIGLHKSPALYGAFPSDPYSHTPLHKGAQQPGMTGQVKEDIICRYGELGIQFHEGKLRFDPFLLQKDECIKNDETVSYVDVSGKWQQVRLQGGQLMFSICQVPVIYDWSNHESIIVEYSIGNTESFEGRELPPVQSASVFERRGEISIIRVFIHPSTSITNE